MKKIMVMCLFLVGCKNETLVGFTTIEELNNCKEQSHRFGITMFCSVKVKYNGQEIYQKIGVRKDKSLAVGEKLDMCDADGKVKICKSQ